MRDQIDGIEKIHYNWYVTFVYKSYNIMKKMLGYDCKTLKYNETAERAKELDRLYKNIL